jgi:chromosome segregation ATPase
MTLAELSALAAVLVTLYGIWNQRRFMAAQASNSFSQSDSINVKDALELKAQYKADMNDLRLELDREQNARAAVEEKLAQAHLLIAELQAKDLKREAAMTELHERFERDALLRANIETALSVATKRITILEDENKNMRQRITMLEAENDNMRSDRVTWRHGIEQLIAQVIEHNDEPRWKPAETGPLKASS